jgi:DUF4097 and DUF4098 domain-containing protein YvlB
MPTFETPEPISAAINVGFGNLRIFVSERADTVVDVRPSVPSSDADVQTAQQTRIEYASGRLLVTAPTVTPWWSLGSLLGRGPSVDVAIELPTDSRIDAVAGELHCEGRVGNCRVKSEDGDIWLDQTGKLLIKSVGDVSVNRVAGHADVSTADGDIWIRDIDGTAAIKTANGDISVGQVTGDVRLTTDNGDIAVDRALHGVVAKTAYGSVQIGEVVRGAVLLSTATGDLEVGIRDGTAAWLDLNTQYGSVRNGLEAADDPGSSDQTVEVRARTAAGDIVIRRA